MEAQNNNVQTICLLIITACLSMFALEYFKNILIPFAVALLLYFALLPLVRYVAIRLKIPMMFSFCLFLLLGSFTTALTSFALFASIESFANDFQKYQSQIDALYFSSQEIAVRLNFPLDADHLVQNIKNLPLVEWTKSLSASLLNATGKILLIILYLFFLFAGPIQSPTTSPIWLKIQNNISGYMFTKVLSSLLVGISIGIIFLICGVELSILFAVICFIFNFLPTVGLVISTLAPLPIIYLQYGIGWQFIICIIIPLIIQFFVGNILEPKWMGKDLGLHPISIIFSLLFWGALWGIEGMLLAVPLTSILKLVFEQIEITKPIARILEGKFSPA